ncbi:MAG: hypothetical protein PHX20_03735 [Candidatus Omnitrophica bacterium]|nr:hypothetical protein [Candidatus Omnitrophota bacterium]
MVRRIKLPFTVHKPILACGADLKGAFAFAKGRQAILVDGLGDLGDLDNFTKYERALKRYLKKSGIDPKIVACDLHPDYFSARFAEDYALSGRRCALCKVQHHEAHIASAIVDNRLRGDVIGVAFDGTGYGSDGNIWGGEFFVGGLKSFRRIAHLEYIPMPGGERAISEPWRMAAAYVYRAFGPDLPKITRRWPKRTLAMLIAMIDRNINSPLTSSAGRLFDAVGSLVLGIDRVSKEAELPVELERIADPEERNSVYSLQTTGIVKGVVADIAKKTDRSVISAKFHNTMAALISETVLRASKKFKVKQVVLSGGVFQNRYLVGRTVERLRSGGLKVYAHENVSTNDSGIPIGQIAIANTRNR